MITTNFESLLNRLNMTPEYIKGVARRTSLNETISEYFELLFDELGDDKYLNIAEQVFECSRRWHVDRYDEHKIYDVTYMRRCRSKYCWNCQKMIQASRLSKFSDLMVDCSKEHDLFHVVLTVPNCTGKYLKATLKCMGSAYKRLNIFFDRRSKIAGVEFAKYGYYASIKSFEITFNLTDREFHPHLHCIFALKKDIHKTDDFVLRHKNKYSYSNNRPTRLFCDFEIFIQKLWRCLFDSEIDKFKRSSDFTERLGSPVSSLDKRFHVFNESGKKPKDKTPRLTVDVINNTKLGYSCTADFIDDDDELNFYEVFKYAFKLCSDDDKILDYPAFRDLYFAVKGLRTLQGYSKWYGLCLNPDEIDESVDEFYGVVQAYLRQSDTWTSMVLDIAEVEEIAERNEYTFITRKSLQRSLNKLSSEDRDLLSSAPRLAPTTDEPRKFYYSNFATAYYRFLQHKKTSPLFADLGRQYVSKNENKPAILILNQEQLSFLDAIF